MFRRYLEMWKKYGFIAAFLFMKVETKTLTKEDVEMANKAVSFTNSTMVKAIGCHLENEPDLAFLENEALIAIAFDLVLELEDYLKSLGMTIAPYAWGDDESEAEALR
jgi:hypothetical protein